MRVYITTPMDLTRDDWVRMQSATIDRVFSRLTIADYGIENERPWVDIPEAELGLLSTIRYDTRRVLTKLAFRRLFTMPERIAFDNFESGQFTDEQKATLRTISKDFELAGEIDMSDPDTAAGLAYLEACGIIAEGRAAAILG